MIPRICTTTGCFCPPNFVNRDDLCIENNYYAGIAPPNTKRECDLAYQIISLIYILEIFTLLTLLKYSMADNNLFNHYFENISSYEIFLSKTG